MWFGLILAAAVVRHEEAIVAADGTFLVGSERAENASFVGAGAADGAGHPETVQCGAEGRELDLGVGRRISNGNWGTVYADETEHYAIKCEDALYAGPEAFAKECRMMQELHKTPARFPDCYGACTRADKPELHMLIMDLVQDGRTLRELAAAGAEDGLSEAQHFSLGQQVYRGLSAMLQHGVVNVDQRGVNIMESRGTVHFIDLGMANSFQDVLNDCKRAYPASNVRKAAEFLGKDAACEMHLGNQKSLMVTSALGALPSDDAHRGAAAAFCEDPHDDWTRTRVQQVEGLTGVDIKKYVLGQYSQAPLFDKGGWDGYWVRNGAPAPRSAPLALRDVPAGAELRAYWCDNEYMAQDARGEDFRHGACAGKYFFTSRESLLRDYITSHRTWSGAC